MKRVLLLFTLLTVGAARLLAQSTVPAVASPIAAQALTVGAPSAEFDLATVFTVPDVSGQIVQFDTTFGKFNVELLATAAPNHVANFLAYVNAGDYSNTFFHRVNGLGTSSPAILQGGGYYATLPGAPTLTKRTAVNLEYNLPNARGTLAAARTSDVNSATSEWFFNTQDNTTTLGPLNASGYSVFARVLGTGMTIVDTIAENPLYNLGGAFTETPLRDIAVGQTTLLVSNFITVNSTTVIPLFPASTGQRAVVSFTVSSDRPSVATATLVAGHTLSINPIGAGSATLTLTATDTNGNSAQTTIPVTVARDPAVPVPTKTQTIKFPAPAPKLATAAPFDLVASATSKLPVSFEIISGPALLGPNGKTLSVTGSGTVVVKASQGGDSTYLPAPPAQASFKVTQATQKITFKLPATKTLSTEPLALAATASSALPVSFAVLSGPATLGADGKTLTLTGAGTLIVNATQIGDLRYQAAPPVQLAMKVTQTTQKITFRAPTSLQLATDPIPLTASASSGLPVTFQIVSGAATLGADGRSFSLTGSGSIVIRATQTGSFLYQAAPPVQVTVNIVPSAQTITFNPPADARLNNPPLLLAATASSGLPVTITVVSGPAVLGTDNRTLTFTGSGMVTLTATQPGSIRIKAAPAVTKKITVNLAPASLNTGTGLVLFSTFDGQREADGFRVLGPTLLRDAQEGIADSFGVTTTHPKISYTYKRLSPTTAQLSITDNYVEVSQDLAGRERRETGTATITLAITFTGLNVNGDTEGTVTLSGQSQGTLSEFNATLGKTVSKPVSGKIASTGTLVFAQDANDLLDYIEAFYTVR